MSMSWKQVTGWAGVANVVVFIVLIAVIGDGPGLSDSAAETREYFADNETQIALVGILSAVALGFLFLLFASGLRSLLGPADREDEGVWSRLMFAAAVATSVMATAGTAFWTGVAQEDTLPVASDSTVKTIASIDTVIYFAIIPWAQAVFLLGASVVIVKSGVLPKWLGWFGLLIALVLAIGTFWVLTGDETSFLGLLVVPIGGIAFLLWILATAYNMIRSDSAATA